MTEYRTYQDILDNGKNQVDMDYNERQRLIKNIDLLDTKDHIGILKIIMEQSKNDGGGVNGGGADSSDQSGAIGGRKIYTVNNYGTYFDLNDLDNSTLWKISYHVNLSLENIKRDEFRKQAEKQYNDDRTTQEDQIRHDSKLKLTGNRLKIEKFKKPTVIENNDDDDDDINDDNESLNDPFPNGGLHGLGSPILPTEEGAKIDYDDDYM